MTALHSTRGRKTNAALREASTTQIRESALKLFVTRGYHSTTMEQIARGAKLTKGGVYFYVAKKEDLLLDLLDDIEQTYMTDPFAAIRAEEVTYKEKIIHLMHFQVRYAIDRPRDIMLLVMMSVELSGKSDKPGRRIEEIYLRLHDFVQEMVQGGIDAGEFRTALPPRELASFFVSAHDGMMLEWYRRQRDIDGEMLVRVFRQLYLSGLAA